MQLKVPKKQQFIYCIVHQFDAVIRNQFVRISCPKSRAISLLTTPIQSISDNQITCLQFGSIQMYVHESEKGRKNLHLEI